MVSTSVSSRRRLLRVSPELEEGLIHFVYGRHLDREERDETPVSHKAMRPTEYLELIEEHMAEIKNVYALLCQITHPATHSLFCFAVRHDRTTVSFEPQVPDAMMDGLISKAPLRRS